MGKINDYEEIFKIMEDLSKAISPNVDLDKIKINGILGVIEKNNFSKIQMDILVLLLESGINKEELLKLQGILNLKDKFLDKKSNEKLIEELKK